MNVYETPTFQKVVENNSYVGRGVLLGKTPDGKQAVTAYFIMGRKGKRGGLLHYGPQCQQPQPGIPGRGR